MSQNTLVETMTLIGLAFRVSCVHRVKFSPHISLKEKVMFLFYR